MNPRSASLSSSSYTILLAKVKKALVEGQARIEAERVRTYWETGRIIHVHILQNKGRADYGAQVLDRLARDLNVDVSVLRRCLKFREKYPHLPIRAGRHEFRWSHFRELMTVPDDKTRLKLQAKASRNNWSAEELALRIKEEKSQTDQPAIQPVNWKTGQLAMGKLLIPLRGTPYTYKLVERPNIGTRDHSGLLVDLGFGIFHEVDAALLSSFSKDQIVESRPKEDIYRFYKTDRVSKDLFTYAAFVEKVIDGDTLKVRLDLGFSVWTRQVLRLRDLDCPEAGTAEGDQARAFVRAHLKDAQRIIVRSSRSDKYDRYLADVFIPQGVGDGADSAADIYLNNLLLEKGLAERVK